MVSVPAIRFFTHMAHYQLRDCLIDRVCYKSLYCIVLL